MAGILICLVSQINVQEVLYRLHFPMFIEQAKNGFGVEVRLRLIWWFMAVRLMWRRLLQGEVIMEEILVHGRVRMDQSLEAMAYSLAEFIHNEQQQGSEDDTADHEISEQVVEQSRERIRNAFVEMAKKRYIARVHPLDLTVHLPDDQPDFPLSITRGQDERRPGTSNGSASNGTAPAPATTATKGKPEDDGITVRGKRKKPASSTAAKSGSTIPVELQMMLEADEARQKDDSSEAEFEPEGSTARSTTKKRKLTAKRAKLPTRGVSAAVAAAAAADGEGVTGMGEQSLVWRFGADQLVRDMRHQACIKFATENINNVAGMIVTAMLKHSSPHEREKDEATSFPVTARELFTMPDVKSALPKDSKDTWRLLLNYITVMCRDKSGMVMKVATETFDPTQARPGDGGQYVVHMKKIVEFLKQATTHSFLQEKYGTPTARIVRLLMEKRQLEQKTIGELALLPSNDTRRRLYELYRDELVQLQEIPKRADHNPAFTLFCWSVNVPHMDKTLSERIQDSLCKLRRRRKFEAEENKDLIARSDQLVEAHDLAKFDKLSRALDRLDRAIVQLDSMLLLYRDF